MANLQKPTERTPLNIPDFQIWKQILYLDSPSDYREYLPQSGVRPHMREADLVMLDASASPRSKSAGARWPLLIIGLVIIVSSGYLLYALLGAL